MCLHVCHDFQQAVYETLRNSRMKRSKVRSAFNSREFEFRADLIPLMARRDRVFLPVDDEQHFPPWLRFAQIFAR